MNKQNIGSTLDSLLDEMGILEEAQLLAQKKGIVRAVEARMQRTHTTKVTLARRMRTSRAQLDRLLDPANTSVTLATVARASAAQELLLEVRLSPPPVRVARRG